MLQSWTNRTKSVRLVAEGVGHRHSNISRSKVDGHVQHFLPAITNRKRSQTGLTCSVHQSWVIAGPTVARLVVQLVLPPDNWWCHLWHDLTIGSATSHALSRLVARPYDRRYHLSLAARDQYTWSASGDIISIEPSVDSVTHVCTSTSLHFEVLEREIRLVRRRLNNYKRRTG